MIEKARHFAGYFYGEKTPPVVKIEGAEGFSFVKEHFKPQAAITNRKRVFDGFFKVDELTIRTSTHDGGDMEVKRLVFERGHAVAILGYDPQSDEVLLVREMHPGLLAVGEYPFIDTHPAGMIDAGEDALEAAAREFREETGAAIGNMKIIHEGAYVSSGGTSEKITLVAGLVDMSKVVDGSIHGNRHEGEDIQVVVVKAREFIARAQNGELHDMKSMVFALWLAQQRPTRARLASARSRRSVPEAQELAEMGASSR